MSNTYAVVMAGGSGTRFWPASRRDRPKQLLPLAGGDDSLLLATVRRILPMVPAERVLIVTAERLLASTREALASLPGVRILAEPAPRNTAPCVGWAASVIADEDPNATVMVLPSDHAITDEDAFRAALAVAVASAADGSITTIGIVPSRPETGYGYIEIGAKPPKDRASAVVRFVEKPDLARATEFVASGKYLWNAGMFFFRAGDMLRAIEAHLPALADGLEAMRAGRDDAAVLTKVFPTLPSISLDHGVLEKLPAENTSKAALSVVPGDFGWNDVGSWQSAWELADKDERGNASAGATVLVDARDNLVRASSGKLIAVVGVEGLCVVETDDALLIIPKERAQDVRAVVEELERRERRELL